MLEACTERHFTELLLLIACMMLRLHFFMQPSRSQVIAFLTFQRSRRDTRGKVINDLNFDGLGNFPSLAASHPGGLCCMQTCIKIKQRRLAISCLISIIFEKAEEMPPSKEVPPGIVGFLIDFACRWCARQEVVVMLRSLM